MKGGPFPKLAPPKELDWDFWLGQAPKVEYIKQRCHGNFRWWYEYSGGKFTDWGAHHVDIAQWAIGQDKQGTGPIEIDGSDAKHPVPLKDGYPTVDDCYNTAHDFAVHCKFANGIMMTVDSRSHNGVLFEGTKGRIFVNRGKIDRQADRRKLGPRASSVRTISCASTRASRSRTTSRTSTAAFARAGCRSPTSSAMCKR